MKQRKNVNEIISSVNELLRNSNPNRLIDGDIHVALCIFADALSQQQEAIDSLQQPKVSNPDGTNKESNAGTIYCRRYYLNGAHAGNIRLCVDVDSWGMNADGYSKAITEEIIKMVSSRCYEYKTNFGIVSILTPHPLTKEQVKEWGDLAGVKQS